MDTEHHHLTKKERREMRRQESRQEQARRSQKRGLKRFLTWFIVAAVLAGIGLLVIRAARNGADTSGTSSQISTTIAADDNVRGPEDAVITLVEYGDYQCSACAAFHPIVEQLFEDAGSQMRLVYRHFPLKSIHPNAETAARAVQAAGVQGKYWEMHALVFERQSEWSEMPRSGARGRMLEYGEELGLDTEQLDEDMDSDAVKDKVDADADNAQALGVNSTPTFYMNGVKLEGFNSLDEFRNLVLAPLTQTQEPAAEPQDGNSESTPAPIF